MEKGKIRGLCILIWAIVLAFAIVVIGCSNPTGNGSNGSGIVPLALIGTWLEYDGDSILTISNVSIINPAFPQFINTVAAVEQVENTRTDEDVNIDFPSGYKITSTVTAVPEGLEEHLGTEGVFIFFLSADGDSFWIALDYRTSLPPSNVWVRE